ncbi:DUF1146 family protein [Fervidibacillus albus]|uniref:DUF1146 family protein n=1 Tax=Fervidibacillus albus TaxID=2980026 RepID=A0A9E8LU30_9BACI|nr:DUF1146 family protein [Fervidibacillus albus]WAA09670.1 DUF1146 family protein [Fervidibacillus albus]
MLENIGYSSMFSILSHLLFIGLAWWALQSLNIEKFFRANRVAQARLLYIMLAIAIGSTVSNFFLDYFIWSNQITYIFQ